MTIPLLLSLAAAMAGSPAGRPPRPHASLIDSIGQPDLERLLAANGMSAEGITALREVRAVVPSADPQTAECAVVAAASLRPLDVPRLAAALARRDEATAAQAARHRTTLVAALGVLGPGDAAIFLQLVGTGPHGGGMGPPPPPGGPGPGERPPGRPGGPPPGPTCPA